jgi:hypothetical protein
MPLSEHDKAFIKSQQAQGLMPPDDQLYPKDLKDMHISVTVDNDLIKKTMNENDDLKAQNEEVKEIRAFFDAEKQKASDKLTKLGIETDSNSIRTKDDLIRANKTIEALQTRENSGSWKGGSVLNEAQTGNAEQKQTFNSTRDMVDALYTNKSDPNTKAVLDKLWEKTINGQKTAGRNFDFSEVELTPSQLMEKIRKPRRMAQ